jgi:glycosyltransferase involved in cell wall biosynthesis
MPSISQRDQVRIIVGIPAYNEARFIADVVKKSKNYAEEVFVINDGSTDDTAQIAEKAMATVINKNNRGGYGESIKSCLEVAKEKTADILVTIDGDGQHNPDEIPLLITPILNREADVVIGSRFLSKQDTMPRYRKLGIQIITFLYNFASKVHISDAQSGFRAYNKSFLQENYPTEKGMAISIEILLMARKRGLVIKEVPISCIYHSASHKFNPIMHGLGVIIKLIQIRLKMR